ncbi:uncharacterized protein LOC128232642 [Mya arenaria]|uniref:uncharacterized protein LOC128232642 n=1 Tax=Mya arenaria TaxID=6604 RepID=UPI0022DFC258|nr:uncharacterized protein LOC128232642 [Mya arenaria]
MNMDNLILVCSLLAIKLIFAECKKCLRNDDIGPREGNIYMCNDPDLPECCEVENKFTCCEVPTSTTFREQTQLWGTVAVFTLALLIVYIYYSKDTYSSDETCCGNSASCCCSGICSKIVNKFCRCRKYDMDHKNGDHNTSHVENG